MVVGSSAFDVSRKAFDVEYVNIQACSELVFDNGELSYSESGETRSIPNAHSSIFDDSRSRDASISLLGGASLGELPRFSMDSFVYLGHPMVPEEVSFNSCNVGGLVLIRAIRVRMFHDDTRDI